MFADLFFALDYFSSGFFGTPAGPLPPTPGGSGLLKFTITPLFVVTYRIPLDRQHG